MSTCPEIVLVVVGCVLGQIDRVVCRLKNLREGKIAVRSIAHNPPIRTSRDPIPVVVNVEFWFIIPIRKNTLT